LPSTFTIDENNPLTLQSTNYKSDGTGYYPNSECKEYLVASPSGTNITISFGSDFDVST